MHFCGYEQVEESPEQYAGTWDDARAAVGWLRTRFVEYQHGVASQSVPAVREWFAEEKVKTGETVVWETGLGDGRSVKLSIIPTE